jgi:hypothetical protein
VDREAVFAGFDQGHPTESERRSRRASPGARIGNDQCAQTGSAARCKLFPNRRIRRSRAACSRDAAVQRRVIGADTTRSARRVRGEQNTSSTCVPAHLLALPTLSWPLLRGVLQPAARWTYSRFKLLEPTTRNVSHGEGNDHSGTHGARHFIRTRWPAVGLWIFHSLHGAAHGQ